MNSNHKVLCLVRSGEVIYEIMRSAMPEEFHLETLTTGARSETLDQLKDAEFVIAVNMDAQLISAAPSLKLIQLSGVGYDGVDLEAAQQAGIPVAQTVEGTILGVAEHTLLLVLALYKHLLHLDASVRGGQWLVWQHRHHSYTLAGKKVGIVGLGRIGREVAKRCRAFDTQILYHDVTRADRTVEDTLGARFLPLPDLLTQSDVVTLHLPLFPVTKGIMGESQFRQMKPTSIFINTARGGLVDEPALVRALKEGWIAGAGLDVFAKEPPEPDHPLFQLGNVLLSPHCATGTRDSIMEKTRAACENFRRVLKGEPPLNLVNT
jgi:phosphoglycerate dehydrogenase-like enzyme